MTDRQCVMMFFFHCHVFIQSINIVICSHKVLTRSPIVKPCYRLEINLDITKGVRCFVCCYCCYSCSFIFLIFVVIVVVIIVIVVVVVELLSLYYFLSSLSSTTSSSMSSPASIILLLFL